MKESYYRCTLRGPKGFVQELFFRQAASVQEIRDYLDFWEWPKGYWEIEEV